MDGVERYAIGTITVPIPFYDGIADCRHCPKCWYEKAFGLYRCRLADEFPMLGLNFTIADIGTRPEQCPVIFKEENNERDSREALPAPERAESAEEPA